MIRCKTCVMPNTRPDVPFYDGECAACVNYKNRINIDWDKRKEELFKLLERHGGRCIVPSSGGKDSSYIAITLKNLGADVTAVTATTCHLTPIGRANIDNLARHVRTIEVTPNMSVRAKLNRLGLELVGDISWPEHASIFSVPFRLSVALGIPLIMFGENPQNCYGGPPGTENTKQMTRRWTQEFGGFLGLRPSDFIGVEGITVRDMNDYLLPPQEDMDRLGIEAHFLGQYIEWSSHRNGQFACEHGMQWTLPTPANYWRTENLDNAQTGLHDHAMYRKYGYGRGCAQISVNVRHGMISRVEALQWVYEHDGIFPNMYADVHLSDVLSRIGLSVDALKHLDRFTNFDLFDSASVADMRPILKGLA